MKKQQIKEQALQDLFDKYGEVTATLLVREAMDPEHPLHDSFTWDDTKAASLYRIEEARRIIRRVNIVKWQGEKLVSVPKYIRNPDKTGSEQGYVSTVTLKSDEDKRREALVHECGRAATALRRAKSLATFFDLHDEVDEILERVLTVRDEAQQPQA